MKRVLFLILLLASPAWANVDSIRTTITNNAAMANDQILHAPRYQTLPLSGRDSVAQLAQSSTNNIQLSADGFVTVATNFDQGAYSGENHDHGFIRGDTLYRWGRNTSYADSNRFIIYDIKNATTLLDRNIGMGVTANYTSAVIGGVKFGDLTIVTARGDDWDFRYAITSDNFTTQTSGYIVDRSAATTAASHNTRMGCQVAFTDSTVLFDAWIGTHTAGGGTQDTIQLWWFNPTDSSWTAETNPPIVGSYLSRFYSVNTMHDSVVVVAAWGSNRLNADSLLIYAYRTTSQTTWTVDTIFDAAAATASATAGLTVIDSTNRMLLYAEYSGGLDVYSINDNFTVSTATTIIGADTTITNGEFSLAHHTPTSHGSQAYCMVKTSGGSLYMLRSDVYEASAFEGYTAIHDGDLPLTISARAAKYYLAEDVSWCGNPAGAGIIISGDSVILDFNGYTLYYGSCDSGRVTGVRVTGDSCTIINGTIQHNPSDSTLDLARSNNIDCGGVNYRIDIHDMTFKITGAIPEYSYYYSSPYNVQTLTDTDPYDGINNILCTGNGQDFNISRCTFYNATTAYWRRDAKSVACINWGDNSISDPPDTNHYNLRADSNTYYSSFLNVRFGIGAGDNAGIMRARGNKHIGRVRNDGPWCPDCSGGYRYGEAYAYDVALCEGFRIVGDTFSVDTATFGQQGLFFVRNSAARDFPNYTCIIDSCKFVNGLGPQGGNHNTALRLRYNLDDLLIKNSWIEATGDTISTDSTFSATTNPLFFGFDACTGSNRIRFENCTIVGTDLDAGNGANINCAIWQCNDAANDTTYFDNCTFISDGAFAKFGVYDLEVDNVYFRNCTFTHGDGYDGDDEFRAQGLTESNDIFVLNPTYSSGVTLTYNPSNSQGENQELTEQVEAIVTVHDVNGDPVNGANVWIVNSYDTVTQKTTGISGTVYDTLSTTYISYLYPDTTTAQYNDFTFGAAYSGDTATVTFTLSTTLNDTTLMFGTAAAETDRPVVLNQNIRISGKVIIK